MENNEPKPLGADQIPEAKDKITREDADKVAALVKLDIAKFRRQRAQAMQMVTDCDLAIAMQEQTLADLERRVIGVAYPEPPAQEPKKPVMGESVGGAPSPEAK